MKPCIVLESHNASYADPIKVAKGEFLLLTGQEDVWDGHRWLWAVADDGREGWVRAWPAHCINRPNVGKEALTRSKMRVLGDDRPSPHDGAPSETAPTPDQAGGSPLLRTAGAKATVGE